MDTSRLLAHRAPPRLSPPLSSLLGASLLLLLMLVVALAAGCGGPSDDAAAGADDEPVEITVFAAASLTESFTALAEEFSAANPDVTVTLNLASSQTCATQIRQGAPADVFASADTKHMDDVADLVEEPRVFAHNELAIVVETGNPKGVGELADLSRDDLMVVFGAPEIPIGAYALEALEAQGVEVEPVSLEETVKAVLTKVELGEADAGIVYVTDVRAAEDGLDGVAIPAGQNIPATYPIAVVKGAAHKEQAQAFVDYVLSPEGQATLATFGFLPADAD